MCSVLREMRNSGCPSDTPLLHYLYFSRLVREHHLLFTQGCSGVNPFSSKHTTEPSVSHTVSRHATLHKQNGLTITGEVTNTSRHREFLCSRKLFRPRQNKPNMKTVNKLTHFLHRRELERSLLFPESKRTVSKRQLKKMVYNKQLKWWCCVHQFLTFSIINLTFSQNSTSTLKKSQIFY